MTENRPFWVEEPALKEDEAVAQSTVAAAVPKMKYVVLDDIVARYGVHDGVLNYHLYSKARKNILDKAESAMQGLRETADLTDKQRDVEMHRIATEGNAALAANPWPDGIEDVIRQCFLWVFKRRFTDAKINFFQEVDSYSVAMPEPITPMGMPEETMEQPLKLLDSTFGATAEQAKAAFQEA